MEPGKRLIRVKEEGSSLTQRLAAHLQKLAWRTPLHNLRLRGRYPLKLLGVPENPLPGDSRAGAAILGGRIVHGGETLDLEKLDFSSTPMSPAMADHMQSFGWLRDLAAAAPRERAAPVAELILRNWLATHATDVTDPAWQPDLWGRRLLAWFAHAPLILSSNDHIYRSAVLNTLARGARHIDRSADKAPAGPQRVAAWAGVIGAGLLVPGGDPRLAHGEAGMARALGTAMYGDGGLANRSPVAQLELIETLARLRAVYQVRRKEPSGAISHALARAVPALQGVTLGDGGLSSWQGGAPIPAARIAAAVEASGVRTRPLRQARDWGYQRLVAGQTTLVLDAAPPPIARLTAGGCASTLAFELSDGPHRLIVNCGGAQGAATLPAELAEALRTTAAHSTLILADTNSTAIHADGSLGRGVIEVELDRQELDSGSRVDVSHDGYVRRHGFVHRRQLLLTADGRQLTGEDVLTPSGRKRARDALDFTLRFHLHPHVEVSSTADGMGALLRIAEGALWQFRCRGGTLTIEESLWIDRIGRPRGTSQIVVSGATPAGGTSIGWVLRRAG
nr:heparinase II/III family protein [Sphingomonas bacterium]